MGHDGAYVCEMTVGDVDAQRCIDIQMENLASLPINSSHDACHVKPGVARWPIASRIPVEVKGWQGHIRIEPTFGQRR